MFPRRVFRQLTDCILFNAPLLRPCFCPCALPRLPGERPRAHALPRNAIRWNRTASNRWTVRQAKDRFVKEAKVKGLMSRAAFKLLQMDESYKIFSRGQTVVDLGYAPGSWSQVAVAKVGTSGRVLGIDIIPAQPPTGVSTIQGNFLSPAIQAEVRAYLLDPERGRLKRRMVVSDQDDGGDEDVELGEEQAVEAQRSYVDSERHAHLNTHSVAGVESGGGSEKRKSKSLRERDVDEGRVVDVVLSDMMMNTSGNNFRDHAGSMDLCMAALTFCYDALKTGGKFVCKFYQGSEEKAFENRLKKLFTKVVREKPESSRSESKEAYFVATGRKEQVGRDAVLGG